MTAPARTSRAFLPEVQALRAVAVLAVIGFHLWPERLPGGYVGVDVFFVISGFLITGHLMREVEASGTVRLGAFWARRIRRLLPAAFLVLLSTLVAVLLLMPQTTWQRIVREIGAAAVYVLNWVLAGDAVDYFAAENAASPVQHYWSLSVEEQFYLVWPVLIVALVALALRRRVAPVRLVGLGLAVVTAASFVHSVAFSYAEPAPAYFATTTHAWEFGLGGLVALGLAGAPGGTSEGMARVLARLESAQRLRAIASVVGFALILVSCFAFTGATVFPGWLALVPVGGAVLVIVAGAPDRTRLSPAPLLALRPVQFVGDVSYSAYLWHWPPIVILPVMLGSELSGVAKLGLLVATFIAAWVTKRLVEDPFRRSPRLSRAPRRAFAFAAAGAAITLVACAVPWVVVDQRAQAAQAAAQQLADEVLAGERECFGAPAALPQADCPDSHLADPELLASPPVGQPDVDPIRDLGGRLQAREHGDPDGDVTIAVVGDSHSEHYMAGLNALARTHGWRIWQLRVNNCTPSAPGWTSSFGGDRTAGCVSWRQDLLERLGEVDEIDLVVTSSVAPRYARETSAVQRQAAAAFTTMWRAWTEAGLPVVVIADVPGPGASVGEALDCVAARVEERDPCTSPRSEVVERDAMVVAATETPLPGLTLLDFTDLYCDDEVCHSVIGGVVVYRGGAHLASAFSMTLAPLLEQPLLDALEGSG